MVQRGWASLGAGPSTTRAALGPMRDDAMTKWKRITLALHETSHLTAREIAEALGYADQYHVQADLTKRRRRGVVDRSLGTQRRKYGGKPNEWRLTDKGRDLVGVVRESESLNERLKQEE